MTKNQLKCKFLIFIVVSTCLYQNQQYIDLYFVSLRKLHQIYSETMTKNKHFVDISMAMGKCPHPPNIAGEFWGEIEVVCITFLTTKLTKTGEARGWSFQRQLSREGQDLHGPKNRRKLQYIDRCTSVILVQTSLKYLGFGKHHRVNLR